MYSTNCSISSIYIKKINTNKFIYYKKRERKRKKKKKILNNIITDKRKLFIYYM